MPTKPGIIYRMDWKTVKDNGTEFSMQVNIYDNTVQIDSITGEEIIYSMTPSGHPLKISTDKSEDKFTPIRSKTATLSFLNSDSVNFSTFSIGEDDRFTVDITAGGIFIFRGFLQMTDIREPFITQKDQEVTLTAIDGLAFLKGVDILDSKGAKFEGMNKIIDYVSMCLYWGTGLSLNINVFNNIREETNPGRWQKAVQFVAPHTIQVSSTTFVKYFKNGHLVLISGSASNNGLKTISSVNEALATVTLVDTVVNEGVGPVITFEDGTDGGCMYSTCYLDIKTFEDKIGTTVDCYTILERILKRECFIEQVLGEWYIFRVKELRNDFQQYRSQYNFDGTFNGFTSGYNLEKAIGLQFLDPSTLLPVPFPASPDAISYFSQSQTSRTNSRPTGSVKLTYKFEPPSEIPCNIALSRGDDLGGSFPDEVIDGITYNVKHFSLDDWTVCKGFAGATPDFTAYIKKYFYFGYENRRFMEIEHLNLTDDSTLRYVKSCGVPMEKNDKFTWSFDYKGSVDLDVNTSTGVFIGSVLLYGDDGSYWTLNDNPEPHWQISNSIFSINLGKYLWGFNSHDIDLTQWNSFSIDAPIVPVSGTIYFVLYSTGRSTASQFQFDMCYANLNLDYSAFIAGGYQQFTGQYNKTTRPGNYKSRLEDQVFISNSPKKLFKGALHTFSNAGTFVLAGRFYDGQEFLYGNDGQNHLMSYGELQVRAVHNQYRNADEVYQLTAQNLNGSSYIDLIHRVFNRDIEPASNGNVYQLLWIDQDWRNSEWQGAMIRNFNGAIGFVGDDVLEFRYETS